MTVVEVPKTNQLEQIIAPLDKLEVLNGDQTPTTDDGFSQSSSDEQHNSQAEHTYDQDNDIGSMQPIKCSAISALETDLPDYDYTEQIRQLRDKFLADVADNPYSYSAEDIDNCRSNDWYLSRFLIRNKMDVEQAFGVLKKAMRYNHEYMGGYLKPSEFPMEFYLVATMFEYERDRKGNVCLYIRTKQHYKVPEVNEVVSAFTYHKLRNLERASNGKGIAIVIDCTGGGLANADMDMLFYLISTLVNYFPKLVSYFLVHELPWILKPFWHIARAWVPEGFSKLVKFSNPTTIFEFIDRENLPDFMGGTCKRSYQEIPENSTSVYESCKLLGIEFSVCKKLLLKFVHQLPENHVERVIELCNERLAKEKQSKKENNANGLLSWR